MASYRHQMLSVLVADVEDFGDRFPRQQAELRSVLSEALQGAFEDAHLDWDAVIRRDRDSGLEVLVPPPATAIHLAGVFLWALDRGLAHLAKGRVEALRPRLSVALTHGLCQNDGKGWFGEAISTAFRLAAAGPVRSALRAAPSSLVLVVSDDLHRGVIRHDYRLVDPALFHEVVVGERDGMPERAWIHVPGAALAPSVPAGVGSRALHVDPEAPRREVVPVPRAAGTSVERAQPGEDSAGEGGGRRSVNGRAVASPISAGEDRRPRPDRVRRADTVADGWSTPHFAVRFAAVRGQARRDEGTPRQDDVAALYHPPTGGVVFALSEGTTVPSDEGPATSGCQEVIEAIAAGLRGEPGRVDWSAVTDLTPAPMVAGLLRPSATGYWVWLVRHDDQAAWVLRDGTFSSTLGAYTPAENGFALEVTGLQTNRESPMLATVAPGDVLLFGTRGFRQALGEGSAAVADLLAGRLRHPGVPVEFAHDLSGLAEGVPDDLALLAVWIQPSA